MFTCYILIAQTLTGAELTDAISPLSMKYIACHNAVVTIGFNSSPDIQYYWYTGEYDETPVLYGNPPANTITVTKDDTPLQIWWVEPVSNGITLPRYKVELELSDNCGTTNPTGCAVTGSIIFKEDFGGNSTTDDAIKQTGIPEVVGYLYNTGNAGCWACYSIRKQGIIYNDWFQVDDHTYPNDTDRGYMLQGDASSESGQFYSCQIDNLCIDTKLHFSMWLTSVYKGQGENPTNQIFLLEDLSGNELVRYFTGDISDNDPTWKQYGFDFIVVAGQSSLIFRIINNGTGSHGNDFVMDDIEIRFCVPEVTIQMDKTDTIVCEETAFTFEGNYTDDGTLGNNLIYRWEYSTTGNPNSPNDWNEISGTAGSSTTGSVTSIYHIDMVEVSHAGYYRLVVANMDNINNYYCRAMLDIVWLQVATIVTAGVATSDQEICYNTVPEPLVSTPATGNPHLTYQWKQSIDNGLTWTDAVTGTNSTTLIYTPPPLTQTTKYRLKAVGGSAPCETDYSNEITVTINPLPQLSINDNNTGLCYGLSTVLNTSSVDNDVSFKWYGDRNYTDVITSGNSFETGILTADTLFYVAALSIKGCIAKDSVKVMVYPLPQLSINDIEACYGLPATLKASSTDIGVSFKWFSDKNYVNAIVSTNLFETDILMSDTVFYVAAVSNKSCKTLDSARVTIVLPPAVVAMDDYNLCYGEEVTLTTLQSDGSISWNVSPTTVSPTSEQQYIVTASRFPCPDASDTVTLTVRDSLYILPLSLPDYKNNNDYIQQLASNAETPVFSLLNGNLPTGLFLSVSGELSGINVTNEYEIATFTVQVEDIHGCTTTKEYTLAKELFMSKIFSPNGDGINDIFMKGHKIIIFDRTGTTLFSGDDGWDGTYKGKLLPPDIYFYILHYKDNNEKVITKNGYIGIIK
jgi:gliding motility-associated-like protein